MLGIVIVSYRSDDRTVRFVREEISRIGIPNRVVVVDNGATEAEAAALAARLEGRAEVIAAENGGYAQGNNLGARRLMEGGDVDAILFTNNDIHLVSDDAVSILYACLRAHPEAGVVGPEIVGTDGGRQSPEPYLGLWDRYVWMYLCTPFVSRAWKRKRFGLDYAEHAQEGPHYKLMGSFLLVDACSFLEAGSFDEGTFLYAEEPILSERLSRIGKVCWFCPSVRVIHEHGAVIGRRYDASERSRMQMDSMLYYYEKYRHRARWETACVRFLHRLIRKV